jgi:hypothetical protein
VISILSHGNHPSSTRKSIMPDHPSAVCETLYRYGQSARFVAMPTKLPGASVVLQPPKTKQLTQINKTGGAFMPNAKGQRREPAADDDEFVSERLPFAGLPVCWAI